MENRFDKILYTQVKLKFISLFLRIVLESVMIAAAPNTQSFIKFIPLNEWRGPGASPKWLPWRLAYSAIGKPVSEVDIEQGVKPFVTATNLPLRVVAVDSGEWFQRAMENYLILDEGGDLPEFFIDPLNADFELADNRP